MIKIAGNNIPDYEIRFVFADESLPEGSPSDEGHAEEHSSDKYPKHILDIFDGSYLQICYCTLDNQRSVFLTGFGKRDELDSHRIKEVCAIAVKEMKQKKINEYAMDVSKVVLHAGIRAVSDVVEGISLGLYEFDSAFGKKVKTEQFIYLSGIPAAERDLAEKHLQESKNVMAGVIFARNMVNTPGNRLRPSDFAREMTDLMKGTQVQVEQLVYGQIKAQGMEALAAVGKSSEYPPYFVILRYFGDSDSKEIIGLVGKGVTCDTGGYCLKSAGSLLGIKSDMAGGAAVAGAIYAMAQNRVKTNAVGLIPVCENRISSGSLLPGDVISSMSGKSIEIINTDAEGRLILADAVTYAIQKEKVTKVLDIATLTAAVVNMLGYTVAGVVTNHQGFFNEFKRAYSISGEKYWRLPVCPEHEKMIESKIADIKNQGESYCGTITAGLFVRFFAEGRPWLHLDIAGTAWVDTPIFEYQSKGGTGAGVTTLYYLCEQKESGQIK